MPLDRLLLTLALTSATAAAQASPLTALPEPATVTLVFVVMAVVGLLGGRQRARRAADAMPTVATAGQTAE